MPPTAATWSATTAPGRRSGGCSTRGTSSGLKIHPDGTRQEFNGKGNFPAKDPTDELRLAPSVETRRIEVVRQIFETYAGEAIPLRAIATRLNDLEVDPVFGDTWNQPKIKHMLANPAYIGFPTWNKRGGSRFVEFVDGAVPRGPQGQGQGRGGPPAAARGLRPGRGARLRADRPPRAVGQGAAEARRGQERTRAGAEEGPAQPRAVAPRGSWSAAGAASRCGAGIPATTSTSGRATSAARTGPTGRRTRPAASCTGSRPSCWSRSSRAISRRSTGSSRP